MNTHETYVSFETAKLLKEARFDWECTAFYGIVHYLKGTKNIVHPDAYSLGEMDTVLEDKLIFGNYKNNKDYNNGCAAPTLCVVQRWLREVKGYSIYPTRGGYKIYVLDINDSSGFSRTYELNSNLTYEESQEAGIKKALEIILENGE